jgi:DNA-binding beta-propeller fold protein YncE
MNTAALRRARGGNPLLATALALGLALALAIPEAAEAGRRRGGVTHEPIGRHTFASPQSNPIALSPDGSLLAVAATTSNRVDLFDTATSFVVGKVPVGIDPVSVAFRPDGLELWVANHVSDSLSVIDTDPASASYLQVVETVQDLDETGATRFDEPVGIAFASNAKAYVALSSRDRVAIVDAQSYAVTGSILIRAQEPRAIAVRGNRLYVAAFESGNQTELGVCVLQNQSDPNCSLGLQDLFDFATNPNLPGKTKNIVIASNLPDRDIFVFDTATDTELKVTSGVGTLLYGLAVDANHRVYVTQTDARNHVNGIVGPPAFRQDVNSDSDLNLADLDNRMFENQVAILDCAGGGGSCAIVQVVDLEPDFPNPATALATPFGVAVSDDGTTVVATAAGTSRVFTMSSAGTVLDRLDVGAIPRGVALRSDPLTGAPQTAYVLNTLGNSVTVVDVSSPTSLAATGTLGVGNDPTPEAVRLGRIAFNDAFGSSSGTFSCASCHPDGNTDQLLWRIGGECFLEGCVENEDEPRTTMPIRGLRDTLPLHWDGTLGDPFGGPTGAIGSGGSAPANCDGSNPQTCFRQLVDASLSGVMCQQVPSCASGPSGLPGLLTSQEREDMAAFLQSVAYPPPRARRLDDSLSTPADPVAVENNQGNPSPFFANALDGFRDFFMDQGGENPGSNQDPPNTCADSSAGCHELPLGTATKSETLEAFDAPTMRGMTDRFLQFSLGVTHTDAVLAFASSANGPGLVGATRLETPIRWNATNPRFREITTFGAAFLLFEPVYNVRPLDIFQMFEEASTGFSGATGRQVTLNTRTTSAPLLAETEALLGALEEADLRGVVNLRGHGLRAGFAITISYLEKTAEYQVNSLKLTRQEMLEEAQSGLLMATLTAHLRSGVSESSPQPLIAPPGANCGTGVGPTGDPALPASTTMDLEAKYVGTTSTVFVDGQPVPTATIAMLGGSPVCGASSVVPDPIRIELGTSLPSGTHLLQVKSPAGLLSNEVPIEIP